MRFAASVVFAFVVLESMFCSHRAIQIPVLAEDGATPTQVDLLTSDQATIERTSVLGANVERLGLLADGDTETSVSFSAKQAASLDVVFGFGDEIVSPERLVVHLPGGDDRNAVPTIEVLVSSLSPHAGFQSLQIARPKNEVGAQEFPFVTSSAKWILLRISPAPGSDLVSLAELSLSGRLGPPATRYEFKESPTKAFEVLRRLKRMVKVPLSEDEQSLFADAADGRLDNWSFADAALVASGVTDCDERKIYLKKLRILETKARDAVADATSPFDKGQRLLKFLHAKVMVGGYVAKQTNLSTLLDAGEFNCVSSAALYNVLARRLMLDARAIEVPDHAFSIVYDGARHADVETTNEQGFNPSRDPRVVELLRQETGFVYMPDQHPEKRREIRETGLIGIIYYNHGVVHSDQGQYADALVRYFCALSLDPEFASSVKNVLTTLANWSAELGRKDAFEDALVVVNVGLELAPSDAALLNNRKVIWQSRVEATVSAGDNDRALALLRQADEQVADGNFRAMQSWVFLKPAEELVEQARWDEAQQLAKLGMAKVDADAKAELLRWRQELFLRWANGHLDKQDYAAALKVLQRGLALWPDQPRLANNLAYVAQEWSRNAMEQEGPERAGAILATLLEQQPDLTQLRETARTYAGRWVIERREAKEYDQAFAAIERCRRFLSEEDLLALARSVYDCWANDLSQDGKWEQALEVYGKAVRRFPEDSHLKNNRTATWDAWAKSFAQAKQWKQAAEVYSRAMVELREDGFGHNLGFVVQEWLRDEQTKRGSDAVDEVIAYPLERFAKNGDVRDVATRHFVRFAVEAADKGTWNEALATIDRGNKFFEGSEQLVNATRHVYDRWAERHTAKGEWENAVEIYSRGLMRLPNDSHLANNASVTWNAWAGTYIDGKDWEKAIDVYERALKVFPDSGTFQNNLEYCKQERDRGDSGS